MTLYSLRPAERLFAKLAARQREALMLREREHMSFEQIGEQMRISKTAAFKLCQKALKGLTNSPITGAFSSE
jgi:DNA-directed RNA polymerase specialized sigma24 family protein